VNGNFTELMLDLTGLRDLCFARNPSEDFWERIPKIT